MDERSTTDDPLGPIPTERRFGLRDVESVLGRLRGGSSVGAAGGQVGLADEALFVARGDGPPVRVAYDDVVELSVQTVDYFLVTMSVVLVGFGLYTLQSSVPGGVGIAIIGLFNAYRTYQRRQRLIVRVSGRTKPLSLYPDDPDGLYDALVGAAPEIAEV